MPTHYTDYADERVRDLLTSHFKGYHRDLLLGSMAWDGSDLDDETCTRVFVTRFRRKGPQFERCFWKRKGSFSERQLDIFRRARSTLIERLKKDCEISVMPTGPHAKIVCDRTIGPYENQIAAEHHFNRLGIIVFEAWELVPHCEIPIFRANVLAAVRGSPRLRSRLAIFEDIYLVGRCDVQHLWHGRPTGEVVYGDRRVRKTLRMARRTAEGVARHLPDWREYELWLRAERRRLLAILGDRIHELEVQDEFRSEEETFEIVSAWYGTNENNS